MLSHSLDWPLSILASGFFQLELRCQLVVKRLSEESAPKFIHIIVRIHFLLILGLRSLCPGWLPSERQPSPSGSLSPVLVHWDLLSQTLQHCMKTSSNSESLGLLLLLSFLILAREASPLWRVDVIRVGPPGHLGQSSSPEIDKLIIPAKSFFSHAM